MPPFFFAVLLSYSVNLKKQSRRPPAKAQNFSYKSSLPAPWNCTRESEIPRRYNHEPAPTSSKSETPRQRNCKSCRARKKKENRARKKTTQPSRNRCPCPQRKNPFQPKRNRAPAPAARKSAIPQSRNCALRETEERKKPKKKSIACAAGFLSWVFSARESPPAFRRPRSRG